MKRDLPVTPRALAAVAIVLAIAIGGYAGLIAPKRRAIARLELQLKAAPPPIASAVPISETEREAWRDVQQRVRARFVSPEDQRRVIVDVARLARSIGFTVTEVQLEVDSAPQPGSGTSAGSQSVTLPFTRPPNVGLNPGIIRLRAQHRFRDLIDFLDRAGRGDAYVALQGLDARRVDGRLESEIRLVSLRWTEEE